MVIRLQYSTDFSHHVETTVLVTSQVLAGKNAAGHNKHVVTKNPQQKFVWSLCHNTPGIYIVFLLISDYVFIVMFQHWTCEWNDYDPVQWT